LLFLRNVNLSKTNLEDAILDNSQISGDLSNITLRYASLLDAILTGVTLNDADLTNASPVNAMLTDANLLSANLTNVSPWGADLTDADLTLANLSESIFSCDSLKTASLKGSISQFHIVEDMGTVVEFSGCGDGSYKAPSLNVHLN
jgi:uncharacterized protein YjbI with pentapeptide repeats